MKDTKIRIIVLTYLIICIAT